MHTHETYLLSVREYLGRLHVNVEHYLTMTDTHALYDMGCSARQGAYAVLEVAARHGHEDANEILKDRKKRERGIR